MRNNLYNIDEVNRMIDKGRRLIIGADDLLLYKLNKGNWIGGTINHFITEV